MSTAPQTVDRVWLRHPTLGTILAEGRAGRWYAPDASRQVWRWYRTETGLDPFEGWLPFEALASDAVSTERSPRCIASRPACGERACASTS